MVARSGPVHCNLAGRRGTEAANTTIPQDFVANKFRRPRLDSMLVLGLPVNILCTIWGNSTREEPSFQDAHVEINECFSLLGMLVI